jgi:hypothetical protein
VMIWRWLIFQNFAHAPNQEIRSIMHLMQASTLWGRLKGPDASKNTIALPATRIRSSFCCSPFGKHVRRSASQTSR